ncbi:hypothetical protein [Salinarimonas sp.]|uniref:hypothetical protein n=1 Tax=Salinarimonas sp. TaxID=2766526 RepID=UPI0032D9AA27
MTRNRILGGVAVVFGLTTLFSGGAVLFGPEETRSAAGAIVPAVLWFNFLSGFVYVLAGIGVFLARPWGRALAGLLAGALAVLTAYFLWHVAAGEPWETRTLAALILRLAFWIAVAVLARGGPPARATAGAGSG